MSRRNAPAILFSDEHLIGISKPPGVLSVPGRDPEEVSLLEQLRVNMGDLYPVHRLDRDTSGVILFARHEEAHRTLSISFERREIEKTYQAIVLGIPTEESFIIDVPLAVDRNNLTRVSGSGKKSVTYCRILEQIGRFSFLELKPETGRQHQIRVHLAAIGCPLAVDPTYGSPTPVTIRDIKLRLRGVENLEGSALLQRTPLHAHRIAFKHPVTAIPMELLAELPKDMRATLQQLRKWGNKK
jgi:23S rRNA pseudouridine955/2504/2580 synthase/23S rRNA pseudouridine1911/1915/1917 synthase